MGKGGRLSRGWRGWREVGPHEEGLGHRTEGPGKEMSEVRVKERPMVGQPGDEDNSCWRKSKGRWEVTLGWRCP